MFTQQLLAELENKVNLVDLIRTYVPDLKGTGSGNYSACCPFHEEKTPSFNVVPKKSFFYCHGCGAHGNAISFVMQINSLNFVDAVKSLANDVGMSLPEDKKRTEKSKEEKESAARFMKTSSALKLCQEIYALNLDQSDVAKEYLNSRGVTKESIELFGLGFAPDAWDTISKHKAVDVKAAELAGMLAKKAETSHVYDRFRNRIMFPIYGNKDYVIGFGGRILTEQKPKYLNSPEGEFFKKGEWLYGLKQAKLSPDLALRVFAVEGYMDVVMLSQHGVRNSVSTLGTAVTESHIIRLLKTSAHVTFCLDGDEPGKNAARRVAEIVLPFLNEFQIIDFMMMPDGLDPDEYIQKHGLVAFNLLASQTKSASEFLLDALCAENDIATSNGMAMYLSTVKQFSVKLQNAPMRLSFNKLAADKIGISLDALLGMTVNPPQDVPVAKENATANDLARDDSSIAKPVPFVLEAGSTAATSLSISVSARLLGVSFIKDPELTQHIPASFLESFLSLADKEMLFPLIVYIKNNPSSGPDSITGSLLYNPHIQVIKELVGAAKLLNEKFDASAEAKLVVESFRHMQRIWDIAAGN